MIVECPEEIVERTLGVLRAAGSRRVECVVLWLSGRGTDRSRILEAYVPRHVARKDQFWIPPEGMREMMHYLREKRLALTTQVHSHPCRAYHSKADDTWAIVRHAGALSIVVPHFARGMTAASFLSSSAFFRLDRDDRWISVDTGDVSKHIALLTS